MPLKDQLDGFPFKSTLSLAPLVAFWRATAENATHPLTGLAKTILDQLSATPALLAPIDAYDTVEEHRALVDLMMSALLPAAQLETTATAAFAPYQLQHFFATPAFTTLGLIRDGTYSGRINMTYEEIVLIKSIRAYHQILARVYDVETGFDRPLVVSTTDEKTGLHRYLQVRFDPCFVEIHATGPVPDVTDEMRQRLLAEPMNLALWKELLPPDRFAFSGFGVMNVVDVTAQEVVSRLREDLLQRDAMTAPARFNRLQNRIRTLLHRPDLQLGLIFLTRSDFNAINGASSVGRSLLLSEGSAPPCPSKHDSFYARAFESAEPVVVHDLRACDTCTGFEKHLLAQDICSLMIIPLRVKDEIVGLLELASTQPGALNALSAMAVTEVAPLFATALQRNLDERENRVQAVIKRQYTALHPAVEWRFREAAMHFIERQAEDKSAQLEPIVFHDVYPLYALADIRDSSHTRNAAIQADLLEQLGLALAVIVEASIYRPLPVLDELGFRIGKFAEEVETALSSEHESTVLDFLQQDVELLLDELKTFGPSVAERVAAYRATLDPELGIVYRKRKDFEESVQQINDRIGAYLDEREDEGQRMYPHYFEKYKTDGVDYNLYVGESLVEDGRFAPYLLRNFRLWQFLVTCGIAWELDRLRPDLKVPLDVTHLILVHSTPLSIRFRLEEKKFDVDGAYNIRYEIVKKRIDKATVRGTGERITQPGKIAVIYSQVRERLEYLQYIEYLQASGYLLPDAEELDLDDMQGVHGLKALRVTVASAPPSFAIDVRPEQVGEAVASLEPFAV